MESLFILVPLSLVAVLAAVVIFFRMNSTGQFEDDQGPAMSILLDDDRVADDSEAAQSCDQSSSLESDTERSVADNDSQQPGRKM